MSPAESPLTHHHSFTEMCQTRPTLVALQYLQTSLSSVVDHSDPAEASAFRMCMTALLSAPAANNCEVPMGEDGPAEEDVDGSVSSLEAAGGGESAERDEELYRARQALFEELLEFLPVEERQPSEDLKEICGRSWEV